MRLIDADYLKKVLNNGTGEAVEIKISKSMPLEKIVDIVIHAYRECLFAELEKVPTAYDLDRVVEQLKTEGMRADVPVYEGGKETDYYIQLRKAVKIVKSGGIE